MVGMARFGGLNLWSRDRRFEMGLNNPSPMAHSTNTRLSVNALRRVITEPPAPSRGSHHFSHRSALRASIGLVAPIQSLVLA